LGKVLNPAKTYTKTRVR